MEPMKPMKPMQAPSKWWPNELGQPSASGSQNDIRYAFFRDKRRMMVRQGSKVTFYDSGDYEISGVSQQQGSATSLVFSSQKGDVKAGDLRMAD